MIEYNTIKLLFKQNDCFEKIQKYSSHNTIKNTIIFYNKYNNYSNEILIDFNDIQSFIDNKYSQLFLKNIANEWFSYIVADTSLFWSKLFLKINNKKDIMVKIIAEKSWKEHLNLDNILMFIKQIDDFFGSLHDSIYIEWFDEKENLFLLYGNHNIKENILGIDFYLTSNFNCNPYMTEIFYRNIHNFIDDKNKKIIFYGNNITQIAMTFPFDIEIKCFIPNKSIYDNLNKTPYPTNIKLFYDESSLIFTKFLIRNKYQVILDSMNNITRNVFKNFRNKFDYFYYISFDINILINDLDIISNCFIDKNQPFDIYPDTFDYISISKIYLNN